MEPTVAGQMFSIDHAVIEAQNHICGNLRSSAVRFGFFSAIPLIRVYSCPFAVCSPAFICGSDYLHDENLDS
jgi:hypothetical protein